MAGQVAVGQSTTKAVAAVRDRAINGRGQRLLSPPPRDHLSDSVASTEDELDLDAIAAERRVSDTRARAPSSLPLPATSSVPHVPPSPRPAPLRDKAAAVRSTVTASVPRNSFGKTSSGGPSSTSNVAPTTHQQQLPSTASVLSPAQVEEEMPRPRALLTRRRRLLGNGGGGRERQQQSGIKLEEIPMFLD